MDYHNDQAFQDYFTEMIEGSPAGHFAPPLSHQYDGCGVPDQEVVASSGDYFYNDSIVGEGIVSYDHDIAAPPPPLPTNEVSPMAASNAIAGGSKKKGGKKRKRDPNKPKGWLTAVLLYSNANRPRAKLDNPNATFGDIGRLLSAEYRALSPEHMALWEKASADDRARHDHEMLSYVPPARVSCDSIGTPSPSLPSIMQDPMVLQPGHKEPKAKKPKKKKDPNAPKRNLSAWQIYSSGEARKQVQKQHPGTSVKEVMCILSRKFKLLADEERAPLDVMAADDKQRYQREMMEYKRVGAYELY